MEIIMFIVGIYACYWFWFGIVKLTEVDFKALKAKIFKGKV